MLIDINGEVPVYSLLKFTCFPLFPLPKANNAGYNYSRACLLMVDQKIPPPQNNAKETLIAGTEANSSLSRYRNWLSTWMDILLL